MTQTILEWLNEKGRDVLQFVWLIVLALLLIWIGRIVIRWLSKLLKGIFARSRMDEGIAGFLLKFCQVCMYLLLAMGVTEVVGIGASSVIAVVGSCGVAIGLALQGSLSNLAGGVLLLATKPFVTGEFIVTGGESGTVTKVDLFYTTLTTADARLVVIPNGSLANSVIQNVSRLSERRIDQIISVSYDSDIALAKRIMEEVYRECPGFLPGKDLSVHVSGLEDSSVTIEGFGWVRGSEYLKSKWYVLEEVKLRYDAAGITIPFPQVDVHIDQS